MVSGRVSKNILPRRQDRHFNVEIEETETEGLDQKTGIPPAPLNTSIGATLPLICPAHAIGRTELRQYSQADGFNRTAPVYCERGEPQLVEVNGVLNKSPVPTLPLVHNPEDA